VWHGLPELWRSEPGGEEVLRRLRHATATGAHAWLTGDPEAAAALVKPANEDVLLSRPVSKQSAT